jgi:integrase
MRGHTRQRSKGSWEIAIDIGRDPATGRRRQHFETVRGTKKSAQLRLAELLVAVEGGSYVKPKRLTLGEYLQEWLQGYVELNCSPRTKSSYEMIVRKHIVPDLGEIPLSRLEPRQLQDFYCRHKAEGRVNGKGQLSTRTVRYCHCLLSEALGHAVKMGLVARNIAQATNPPHVERKARPVLAPEDVPNFLEAAAQTPYHALFYTLLFTGMRRGEALALRWKSVDLMLLSLSVVETAYKLEGSYKVKEPKTAHSQRQITLPPSLALVLHEHKAGQMQHRALLGRPLNDYDFVFAHSDGTPLDPSTVSHAFANVVRKAGLPPIRLHDLRHTHATLMLKAGVHPKIVSERLGHSSIRVTLDTYSHVMPGLQEAAARIFDEFMKVRSNQMEDVGNMLATQLGLDVGVAGFEPATT